LTWRITYTVETHTRDSNNYPETILDEVKISEGNTLEEAEAKLFDALVSDGILSKLVEKYAGLTYIDFWRDIDIISVDKVSEETSFDFHKSSKFLALVEERKAEIESSRKRNEEAAKNAVTAKELELLEKLENKYRRKA